MIKRLKCLWLLLLLATGTSAVLAAAEEGSETVATPIGVSYRAHVE